MAYKTFYTQKEATKFLNVTQKQLEQLTTAGYINLRKNHKQLYFLAGELEIIKDDIPNLLKNISRNALDQMVAQL